MPGCQIELDGVAFVSAISRTRRVAMVERSVRTEVEGAVFSAVFAFMRELLDRSPLELRGKDRALFREFARPPRSTAVGNTSSRT